MYVPCFSFCLLNYVVNKNKPWDGHWIFYLVLPMNLHKLKMKQSLYNMPDYFLCKLKENTSQKVNMFIVLF